MAVAAIAGVLLVWTELDQLTNQNHVLERSLLQSFRPLGWVHVIAPGSRSFHIGYDKAEIKGRWSGKVTGRFSSAGQGPLIFLGYFYHASTAPLDFRSEFLDGDVTNVRFDEISDHERRQVVLPQDTILAPFALENLTIELQYFLQGVFLYEDQDGQLFDTHLLVEFNFEDTLIQDPIVGAHGDTVLVDRPKLGGRFFKSCSFHEYSEAEKSTLINRIA